MVLLELEAPGSPQWGNAEGPPQGEVTQNRDWEENHPHPKGWTETHVYCTGESSEDATEPAAGRKREPREQATCLCRVDFGYRTDHGYKAAYCPNPTSQPFRDTLSYDFLCGAYFSHLFIYLITYTH